MVTWKIVGALMVSVIYIYIYIYIYRWPRFILLSFLQTMLFSFCLGTPALPLCLNLDSSRIQTWNNPRFVWLMRCLLSVITMDGRGVVLVWGVLSIRRLMLNAWIFLLHLEIVGVLVHQWWWLVTNWHDFPFEFLF